MAHGVLFGFLHDGKFDETRVQLHSEAETELGEFVFDFVEGLFAEVAVFEHLGLALESELTHRCDVCVIEAVCRAHGKLDFIDTHVEKFLESAVFLADLLRSFIKLNDIFVESDEHVEVVAQDSRSLKEGFGRSDATVGPDFKDNLVVVGALARDISSDLAMDF
jgi:hypothetical protein